MTRHYLRRSMFLMFFIFLMFLMSLFWSGTLILQAASEPDLAAKNAVLADLNTGAVYWSKAAEERVYPASITKLMTAMLVLEDGRLDTLTTVSQKAVETDGSTLYVEFGETLKVRDLLYGLLLVSANDAAVVLAERETGHEADFVARMNRKAEELGATNTHFTNSHGLHEDDHYTTAKDFSLIARAAWQTPGLVGILQTLEYRIPSRSPLEDRVLINNNRLLDSFEGILGGKNGYTDEAGFTFVGYASQNGLDLLSLVFDSDNIWYDTTTLLQFGFDYVESSDLLVLGAEPTIGRNRLSVVVPPSYYGVLSGVGNRVLRLQTPDDTRSQSSVSALLLQRDLQPTEVQLRYLGTSVTTLPLWREPFFWLFLQLLFWLLIYGVYRLIKARIEFLSHYRRSS